MFIEEGLYDFIEDFNSASGSRSLAANSNVSSESSANNSDKTYLVYPNPFTDEINIKYQLNETDILITELIEIGTGKILFNKKLSVNETSLKLNVKGLISGIYLMSFIRNNDTPVYYKLVNIKE